MICWEGKKILIIGAARQGIALTKYLAKQGALITLNDQRLEGALEEAQKELSGLNVHWITGAHPLDILDGKDLVCLSGGIPLDLPLVQEAIRSNISLSNDSQIFLEAAPCPVIGITGSSGKTTTTALVGEIAKRHYEYRHPNNHVWVGGNIGNPLILDVEKMTENDIAVMELSSFQLEIMNKSPHIAAILNLTPNHLDRHKSMAKYISAKSNILTHQNPDDVAVLNRDDSRVRKLFQEVKGQRFTFGIDAPFNKQDATYYKRGKLYLQATGQVAKIMKADLINLQGRHNLYNTLAAIAISAAARFSLPAIYDGIIGFEGIPHRLEFIREWGGATWYNDSIATTPERAIAALESFKEPIVLLAGGRDKHLPWEKLAELIHYKVDHLILFGEAVDIIQAAVDKTGPDPRPFTIDRCDRLEEAIHKAAERVERGDVVLLSPGGTSFDEFIDFEERGKRFIQWVKELT